MRSTPAVLFRLMLVLLTIAPAAANAQSERGYARLMQGPMLGPVTAHNASLWCRGSGEFEYQIEYATNPDFTGSSKSGVLNATKANDYTMVFELTGLEPDTEYFYRVLADGSVSKYQRNMLPWSFRTFPDSAAPFRVAFGSCARFQAAGGQPVWGTIKRAAPDMFFWLGDNIYGDSLDPDILAEEYRRQREMASILPVIRTIPQLATWDDHDAGLNDHDRTSPVKDKALRVFKQYWPNPSYGLDDAPGVFFKYSHAGVDFFFTDCRYHRDPNKQQDSPTKTMLGEAQYDWLIEGLEASDAPLKFIISGSGFNSAKGPGGDSWSSFLHERDRLFSEIAERDIGGVILLSGDTHVAELNRINSPHKDGYPLYEVVSSPLAQAPNSTRKPLTGGESRVRPFYPSAPNFAVLDIDPTGDDPVVTINVVDMYGEHIWEPLVLRASQLRTER